MGQFRNLKGNQIAAVLDTVLVRRHPVRLIIDRKPPMCTSRIRDLRADRKRVDFYTLDNEEADRRMEPGNSVEGVFLIDRLPHRFSSVCVESGTTRCHSVAWPTAIEVIQRRDAFRVQVPVGTHVDVTVSVNEESAVHATLLNVSQSGALIEVRRDDLDPESDTFGYLLMNFGQGEKVGSDVRLTRVEQPPDRSAVRRIGLCFQDMPVRDRFLLGQIIMRWQREARREQVQR